jgi:hypothetical protein
VRMGGEVDEIGSALCPVAGYGISSWVLLPHY